MRCANAAFSYRTGRWDRYGRIVLTGVNDLRQQGATCSAMMTCAACRDRNSTTCGAASRTPPGTSEPNRASSAFTAARSGDAGKALPVLRYFDGFGMGSLSLTVFLAVIVSR